MTVGTAFVRRLDTPAVGHVPGSRSQSMDGPGRLPPRLIPPVHPSRTGKAQTIPSIFLLETAVIISEDYFQNDERIHRHVAVATDNPSGERLLLGGCRWVGRDGLGSVSSAGPCRGALALAAPTQPGLRTVAIYVLVGQILLHRLDGMPAPAAGPDRSQVVPASRVIQSNRSAEP